MGNAFAANKTINSREYSMVKFGALKSIAIATRLGKALAAGASSDEDTVAAAILGSLDDEAMVKTITELCSEISYNGKAINFDTHFVEFQEDLLPIMAWSLKENVMGFFGESALEALSSVMESLT